MYQRERRGHIDGLLVFTIFSIGLWVLGVVVANERHRSAAGPLAWWEWIVAASTPAVGIVYVMILTATIAIVMDLIKDRIRRWRNSAKEDANESPG